MPVDQALPRQSGVERTSVLAVTSETPWPLDSGGHLRSYHLLKALAGRFDVRVVAPQPLSGVADALVALRSAGIRPYTVDVAPRSFSGELVKVLGAAVRREPYVMFSRHRHGVVRQVLEEELERQRPAVLYLDHLDSLVYANLRGQIPVVVDMHNIYSRLAARAAVEAVGLLRNRYLARQARLLEQMERRAVTIAHTVFAVSFDEARYFRNLGAQRVVVVPNGVDCAAFGSIPMAQRNGPPTILYVGSMAWPPNASAATFLARQVLPAIWDRIPDARLVIVGKTPPPAVRELASGDRVKVVANVPDVLPYYRDAHVLAVPLQAGGGTRLKILEAFAAGLPVVSTRVGCEGLDVVSGRDLVVAERSDFARALTELLADPSRGRLLAQRGRALALAHYDWPIVGGVAADAVQRATDNSESTTRTGSSGTEQTVRLSPIGRL